MRTKKGIITSDKMDKTVVVTVHSYKTHPKYKKRYRVSKKFYAHDEKNSHKAGEEITIYETTPLSRLKRWTTEAPTTHIAKQSAPSSEASTSEPNKQEA